MKENLFERISILENNDIISKKVADYTREVVELILSEVSDVSQDKMEMFITHLAMAGKRAEEGTEENPIDEVLLEAMMEEPVYPRAVEFRDMILTKTDIAFPKTERDFLSVHLCNLLS